MQTIDLDISKLEVPEIVNAKQGDVGRKFCARICDNGQPFTIPDGASLSIWYSGTSGMGNYSAIGENSAYTVEENAVTVELITQMLSNRGGGTLCLVLHGVDGSQLGLWNIPYVVEPVPGMESVAAQKYYTALSEVASHAAQIAQRIESSASAYLVDSTLTQAGQAAEAATVGSLITQLSAKITNFSTHWWHYQESVPVYSPLQENWADIPNGTFAAHMIISGGAYAQFGYKQDNYGVAIMLCYAFSAPYIYVVRNLNGVWSVRKLSDGGAL